jgi:hypothetical protein
LNKGIALAIVEIVAAYHPIFYVTGKSYTGALTSETRYRKLSMSLKIAVKQGSPPPLIHPRRGRIAECS